MCEETRNSCRFGSSPPGGIHRMCALGLKKSGKSGEPFLASAKAVPCTNPLMPRRNGCAAGIMTSHPCCCLRLQKGTTTNHHAPRAASDPQPSGKGQLAPGVLLVLEPETALPCSNTP